MKSKKILLVTLILVSLTALLFTGCTPAAEKKDDSKTELPNPMVEQTSLTAIKDTIGFTFETLPTGISDVKYFTISDDVSQADFTLNAVSYTARKGAAMIDDIAGVYTDFQSGETKANTSGIPVLYQTNPDGMGLATWKTDNYTYSVYCETGFDLAGMETVVNGVS